MRTTILALAVILAGAVAGGCSPSKASDADPVDVCRQNGDACSLPSQCCSSACNGVSCIDPATSGCKAVGYVGCTAGTQCCTGSCENGTCVEPSGSCELLGQACTQDGNCCSGDCDTSLASPVCKSPPPPACGGQGAACTDDSQCCSYVCGADNKCTTGICKASGSACGSDTECCSLNCPGAPTPGATCSSAQCRESGTGIESSCSDGSQCCSGICSSGHCSPVPPASGSNGGCTTLGETCTTAANTCCSTNCQGGNCMPASFCNAPGDICWRSQDCCSGLCTVSAGSATPGRCLEPSGSGCTQDGAPCANDSNCCTRKCVDLLGTGAKVCQPAGGCRMTGDYCDSTQSCCGGTDPANTTAESPYGVYCDLQGVRDYSTYWDPSSKDNHVCSAGQSCNPPGNICGGTGSDKTNASQNCCTSSPLVKGSDVCKQDLNRIWRCFGGGSSTCTTGWDGSNAQCCIQPGDVCQFRDQCCDFAPCVPDTAGVLRCSASSQCLPRGAQCSTAGAGGPAPTPDPCCGDAGETCRYLGSEVGWACAVASCITVGNSCSVSSQCCVGSCVSGTCRSCFTTGVACTSAGDCCSGICTGGKCGTQCIAEGATCTATSDCCPVPDATVSCVYQPGATSGLCTASAPPPTCAGTGESCTADGDCCSGSGNICTGGYCNLPPAPTCGGASQACTGTGQGSCCDDLWCRNIPVDPDPYNPPPPTACSGTYCACEGCSVLGEDCSTTLPCCLSSNSRCANPSTYHACAVGEAGCKCIDVNM